MGNSEFLELGMFLTEQEGLSCAGDSGTKADACKRMDLWVEVIRAETLILGAHRRCSVCWCGPVGWMESPTQAVTAEDGSCAPLLLDIRLWTPSAVIKVEFPLLAALLVLSSEQETRTGRDELGCGCSLGKPGYFPGRLKPPFSLINKSARSGLAQQKEDRSHSSTAHVSQGSGSIPEAG